jgi:hypothetical protein
MDKMLKNDLKLSKKNIEDKSSKGDDVKQLKEYVNKVMNIANKIELQNKELKKEIVNVLEQKNNNMTLEERKYDATLKFLNIILKRLAKDNIDKLDDFKILRSELLTIDDGIKLVTDNIRLLCGDNYDPIFHKNKDLDYTSRDYKNCYLLTVLKALTKGCGYEFKNMNKKIKIDNEYKQIKVYKIKKI